MVAACATVLGTTLLLNCMPVLQQMACKLFCPAVLTRTHLPIAPAAQVADGMYRSLPPEAAAALIPLGGVQLRCCPDEAVRVYTLPQCASPPPHTSPVNPTVAASLAQARACLAPAVPSLAGASCTCTCGCGNVHADALLPPAAELK